MKTINELLKVSRLFSLALLLLVADIAYGATDLADKPLFSSSSVPGNVALALSVEYPTAITSSYKSDSYSLAKTFKGYFDSEKCYSYERYTSSDDLLTSVHHFVPSGSAVGHSCAGLAWSGNFLNFATTQTIDPFRQALTGGFRRVDTVSKTVLEKAFSSSEDNTLTPIRTITGALVSQSTPYNWNSFSIRTYNLGRRMWYSNNGNLGNVANVLDTDADPNDGSKVYEKYVRVQVCVVGLLESNCKAYGSNYKPEGLIQKNYLKLNFAAFGYLKESGNNRNGGVLRARMSPVGPRKPVPNAPDEPNLLNGVSRSEWNENTGVFALNPAPADSNASGIVAPASGIGYSGVINYLNNFGVSGNGYKSNDPVSELYYAVTRYYKNQGNLTDYTNNLDATKKDGFPVITNWDEPVKYSCQSNFIIGIGDVRTHADSDLPGSTIGGNNNAVDPTVNVVDVTNRVGDIERAEVPSFLTSLGTRRPPNCCGGNSYFMAGLAYDIHTKDILTNLPGKQTVSTYWLDVLEGGFSPKNQFWLAAKYGGFDVPASFEPYSGVAEKLATVLWNKNGDGDPDNYFQANNPQAMSDGLGKAFDDILKKISGSSGGFAIPTPSLSDGTMSFATSYTVDGWTGNVIGNTLSVTSNGVSEVLAWNAVDKLEAQSAGSTGWRDNRYIATVICADADTTFGTVNNCVGVPFRLDRISPVQTSALTFSGATPQNLLDFLRGDRSNAGASGLAIFRDRKKILGDIVNSRVLAVGPPNAPYTDAFNAGYAQFKFDKRLRETVAYVGANDGMLHAFRGTPSGGNELFAFVPNAVFAGPNNTPQTDGLAALAKSSYVHHQYVDASPVVQDVFYSGSWHSLLVSGLGKGGKSYFAIDVTNPSTLSSEGNLPSAVKWEFKHKYMGYTYGNPVMVKTAKHGWVVILTSGYNNEDGKGYFFIINPQTGELLEPPISTGEGSVANPAGLAHANAYVSDFRSYVSDAVYAGDLLGNVWRLDLTSRGSFPAPIKIATLSSGGLPQPVTTAPLIQIDPATSKRYVFIGTGKLLADSDIKNTQQQTFYAINDGTANAVYTTTTLPAGSDGYPVTRNDLIDNTTSLTGVDISTDPSKPMGYFIDLGFGGNGIAYRVNIPMVSGAGVVAFAANLTGGDECNPSGSNKFYALYYGTGATALSPSTLVNGVMVKQAVKSIDGPGLAVSIKASVPDTTGSTPGASYTICDAEGNCKTYTIDPASGAGFTSMNWRELPSAD